MSTRRHTLSRLRRLEEELKAACPACGTSSRLVVVRDEFEAPEASACELCGRTPPVIVVRYEAKEGEGF